MIIKSMIPLFITSLLLFSCSKSRSDANGIWTLLQPGNRTTNSIVNRIDRFEENGFTVLSAFEKNKNMKLKLWWKEWPQTSQQYIVVDFLQHRDLGQGEMGVTVDIPAGTYFSTGMKNAGVNLDPAYKVNVVVENGKLNVTVPIMSGYAFDNPGIDSAVFEGSFFEK